MRIRSSFSTQQGACVEVEQIGDEFHLTDSKHPERPAHIYTRTEWRAFLQGARNGEFDFDVFTEEPAN
ncbi:DUF397 domain-containing protein [Allosalinactinospora lopnorensis]|uniref:DUF397 domain-containing protein n=1 Tax=Allosalinactinospora lopnorensis TaxID=1352348 RepID=UPI000623E9D0|nr:DUF397 domain-containing protein [Allosalinactinospora lopnorensis]